MLGGDLASGLPIGGERIEARGLGGALRTVAAQPYGKWLLGITALGLIAYGLYDFILARYRRIRV